MQSSSTETWQAVSFHQRAFMHKAYNTCVVLCSASCSAPPQAWVLTAGRGVEEHWKRGLLPGKLCQQLLWRMTWKLAPHMRSWQSQIKSRSPWNKVNGNCVFVSTSITTTRAVMPGHSHYVAPDNHGIAYNRLCSNSKVNLHGIIYKRCPSACFQCCYIKVETAR